MVVETGHESIIEAYEQNFFNPLCFLQYHDPFISPSDFNNSEVRTLIYLSQCTHLQALTQYYSKIH